MDRYSYLNSLDNSVIEELFEKFRQDPESVEESWKSFFEGFEFREKNYQTAKSESLVYPEEFKVIELINGYRHRGHLFTKTNPVRTRRTYSPTLDISNFGLSEKNLSQKFHAGTEIGLTNATLSEIISKLNQTYCQSIGVEFMYIRRPEIVQWLKLKMEDSSNTPAFDRDRQDHILQKLAEAVLFEKFVHKKFPGHKSFSLEGVESLIPAIDTVIEKGVGLGAKEFVIGMAHRGRLNVLGNIMQKPFVQIFSEFEGKEYKDEDLLGDVKYHLGFSGVIPGPDKTELQLTLAPNPSHLEAVDPVVEGITRARIDNSYKGDVNKIVSILIHGDASISGQGVVYEVLQMSDLTGFRTGGTIHLIVNNQLGFTTNYLDGRSSIYCTDVGKTVHSPVFHVNADDVEAVVYTVMLAMEFRQTFHKDVFVDLLGYRKYGHNESDEPRFTQPLLYKAIETHPDPLEIYIQKLQAEKSLLSLDINKLKENINIGLEEAFVASQQIEKGDIRPLFNEIWTGIRKSSFSDFETSPVTAVDLNTLLEIGRKITELPQGIKFFRKIIKLQDDRRKMLEEPGVLDWSMGELLAFGTLINDGIPVRLSGQDSQRGTFSQRHSVLTVEDSEEIYVPLEHLSNDQVRFDVVNSLLSEYGVLGFEYGYGLASPHTLTIWEAQFGDFCNGAQVIIDQYITSAEDKWRIMNGLVLFLPHGYEGQGPDHSSARLERFLTMCEGGNMQVVNCTTPSNLFHLLRRQMIRPFRKPLIVFTPKSLLRHPRCVSPLSGFTSGGFKEVIDDETAIAEKVKRVLLCSGKVYYDIIEEKEKLQKQELAVIRIEQIYPFPIKQLKELRLKYKYADRWEWIQEEPANMGALEFILQNFKEVPIHYTARPSSGSTATGSGALHKIQQRLIVEKAMGQCNCESAYGSCKLKCAEQI